MAFRLNDPKDVRDRLALPDDEGLNDVIRSALDASYTAMESILETTFSKGSRTDLFYVDPRNAMPINGLYLLKASNGFLRASPTITAAYGCSLTEFSTVLASTEFVVTADKGFIQVPESVFGSYVRVIYEYGFQTIEEVPDWLREVSLNYTIKIMSVQQIGSDKPDLSALYKFVNTHYATILDTHLRMSSRSIRSINN